MLAPDKTTVPSPVLVTAPVPGLVLLVPPLITPSSVPLPDAALSISKPPLVLIVPEGLPRMLPPLAFSVTFSTLEDELIGASTMMLPLAVRVKVEAVPDVFAMSELTVMLPAPDPDVPVLAGDRHVSVIQCIYKGDRINCRSSCA